MISIIGAGPSGSHLACLLSKHDDVNVYEEHSSIGKPVQCTGLVTSSIKDHLKLESKFILNKIKDITVIAPSKQSITFNLKNPNIIIDRELFDKHMAEKAIDNGAKYNLSSRFISYSRNKISIKTKKITKTRETDLLVGADGPLSNVAKSAGLFKNRKFVIGLQARIKLKDINVNELKFFLGYGSFAWIVPENEFIAKVGVVSKQNPKMFFNHLLKEVKQKKIIEHNSGIIPIYDPNIKIEKGNVFLVGDAAAQVKATSYGGIIQGLTAAENLSRAIINEEIYTALCKDLNKELKYGLLIRNVLDKFSLKDYDDLISLVQDKKTKSIIQSIDRDYPSKMILKLMLSQPRFLKFAKKLI